MDYKVKTNKGYRYALLDTRTDEVIKRGNTLKAIMELRGQPRYYGSNTRIIDYWLCPGLEAEINVCGDYLRY